MLLLINSSLHDLQNGIKGLVVMSSDLEEIFVCIFEGRVPSTWLKGEFLCVYFKINQYCIKCFFSLFFTKTVGFLDERLVGQGGSFRNLGRNNSPSHVILAGSIHISYWIFNGRATSINQDNQISVSNLKTYFDSCFRLLPVRRKYR